MSEPRRSWRAAAAIRSALLSLPVTAGVLITRLLLRPNGSPKPLPLDLANVGSILVIRTDAIGDAVLFSPFLRGLREAAPRAKVVLVVSPAVRDLVGLCPYVDDVVVLNTVGPRYLRPLVLPARALSLAIKQLRGEKFSVALAPRWWTDAYYSGLLAPFSGAATRVSFSEDTSPRKREMNSGYDRMYTSVLGGSGTKHEVERNSEFLQALGAPTSALGPLEVWLSAEDQEVADKLLCYAAVDSRLSVALGIGAGEPHKEWPIEKFIELARCLVGTHNARVVLVGGKAQQNAGTLLADSVSGEVVNLCGRTTLRQTAAAVKRCSLFIGNDSGPKHLAVAAGIAVVEISSFPVGADDSHWNSPRRFGPWCVPSRIVQPVAAGPACANACVEERAHCIATVSVKDVQAAAAPFLDLVGANGEQSP